MDIPTAVALSTILAIIIVGSIVSFYSFLVNRRNTHDRTNKS